MNVLIAWRDEQLCLPQIPLQEKSPCSLHKPLVKKSSQLDGNIESGATHLIFLPLKTVQPSGECGAKTAGAFSA